MNFVIKNMKQIFTVLFLIMFLGTHAQFRSKTKNINRVESDNKDFSFAYYLGVNFFDYKLHPNTNGLNDYQRFLIRTEPKMGFQAGFIGKWRLNKYFDFRTEPGIYFVQRKLIFDNVKSLIGTTTPSGQLITASDTIRNIKSTYIDIPAFINIHGERWKNTRPYMQAGISWMVNIQSNEKKLEDNLDGVFRTKTNNFTWQFEMGIDIYFRRFKLTPAVKGIFFFNNEWFPDNEGTPPYWSGALTSLSTRAFMFSLKFE